MKSTRLPRMPFQTWAALAVSLPCSLAGAQTTERVSVDSAGGQVTLGGAQPAISADGRFVAFVSSAANLVPGDTNGVFDDFVHDRVSGTTERVSVDSAGVQANGVSLYPSLSADGRFVVVWSLATNLVPGDTNGVADMFVRDRQLGITERVSVNSAGQQANAESQSHSISADGRFIVFASSATNLVAGDTNACLDVFVRDRLNGTTERVSVDSGGVEGNSHSSSYTGHANLISADGRFVVFDSWASNLVPGDTNACLDVFVRDRLNGTTERASVHSSGAQANSLSMYPSISADGRCVSFCSIASNLVTGDTNGVWDVFVHDRVSAATERVSVDSAGGQAGDANITQHTGSLSYDGRFVAFMSFASNLVPGDTNGKSDIFLRDRLNGTTERMSMNSSGNQANGHSYYSALSADGRFVAFDSHATNLVSTDTNAHADVFERDRGPSAPGSDLCQAGTNGVIGCPCSNPPAGFGRGCENSSATGGAALEATGIASLAGDTVVFTTHDEPPTATSVAVQGTAVLANGAPFGQGVRCAGGALLRLYVQDASSGSIRAPLPTDPPVSARSAFLGDPIFPGTRRYYQVYYRDPIVLGGCPAIATFNVTQAVGVPWSP